MLAFASESNKKKLAFKQELKSYSFYLETTPPSIVAITQIKRIEFLLFQLSQLDNSPKISNAFIKASTLASTKRDNENFPKLYLELTKLLKAIK